MKHLLLALASFVAAVTSAHAQDVPDVEWFLDGESIGAGTSAQITNPSTDPEILLYFNYLAMRWEAMVLPPLSTTTETPEGLGVPSGSDVDIHLLRGTSFWEIRVS